MCNKWLAHSIADMFGEQPNFCQTSHSYPWPTRLAMLNSNILGWFLSSSSLESGCPLLPFCHKKKKKKKNRLDVGIINNIEETSAWASLNNKP